MKKLRTQLMETQAWLEARLKGQKLPKPAGLITQNEQLWEPLYACYKSLQACGMGIIANGELLDTLRRVKSFRRTAGAYRYSSGKHPPYRSAGRNDPLSRHRRLRKLVRSRQTGLPDPRTELQTSAAAAQWEPSKKPAKCSTPAK
jgi:phosphoenolpyruvate carboxylase